MENFIQAALTRVAEDSVRAIKDSAFISEHYQRPIEAYIAMRQEEDPDVPVSVVCDFRITTNIDLNIAVDSVKEIAPIMRFFIQWGLRIDDRPSKDHPSQTKVFGLVPRGTEKYTWPPTLRVCITARRCERVEVGKKEVPVYEIICH